MASPGIAVTSWPSIRIVHVGCPDGISPVCETVGICCSAGCVYRSRMLMPCPLYPATPEQRATAGKASGCSRRSGTLPQRAGRQGLPAIRQAGEKGPASTRAPRASTRRWRAPVRSRLRHGFVSARAHRRARAGRAAAIDDVRAVLVGELAHRRAEDRGRGDAEPAEREALHVHPQLVEPGEIALPAQPGVRALEDPLDALRPDAARHADRAVLLREVGEEPRRLVHDAHAGRDRAHLGGAHVRPRGLERVEVEPGVRVRRCEDAAGGSADVDRLQPAGRPAGFIEDGPQRRPEEYLVDTRPRATICGSQATVSALAMSVGRACTPFSAGYGGRWRAIARFDSSRFMSALSSPPMKPPGPTAIEISTPPSEPSIIPSSFSSARRAASARGCM